MNAIDQIQDLVNRIDAGAKNNTGAVYINIIKNEFITLKGKIAIPSISVKELDYSSSVGIVRDAAAYIPEFLHGHTLMPKRVPASEQHSLQFIRPLPGMLMDFIHLYKIDLRFGGGSGEFIDRGNSDFYPSYYTDRLYYKSRLIPVKPKAGSVFSPLRIFDSAYAESDQYFHTFAMFEDINYKEITREMHAKMDLRRIFPVSPDLFPFVEYDYFTACLNVIYPAREELESALKIFEPLFYYIYGKYRDVSEITPPRRIVEAFPDALLDEAGALCLGEKFMKKLEGYFGRFSAYRDDDLALRGWWRIDCV